MKQITYTRCGDYNIPNLILSDTETKSLGKYGRMRKNYLKEHRPVLWNSMILSEEELSAGAQTSAVEPDDSVGDPVPPSEGNR